MELKGRKKKRKHKKSLYFNKESSFSHARCIYTLVVYVSVKEQKRHTMTAPYTLLRA